MCVIAYTCLRIPLFSLTCLSFPPTFICQKAESQKACDSFTCQMCVCISSSVCVCLSLPIVDLVSFTFEVTVTRLAPWFALELTGNAGVRGLSMEHEMKEMEPIKCQKVLPRTTG